MTVTAAGLKVRFPEYAAVADATLDIWIGQATRRFNDTLFTDDDLADDALYFFSAHLYTVSIGGSAASTGAITSKKVGDLSVNYATGVSSSYSYGMDSTYYGQQFLLIMKSLMFSPMVL